uniref:Uncharacterized protein n=1 Tax=Anguilla anguilla TaxID=7936 RepID=A0A0E9R0M1_ANGAN
MQCLKCPAFRRRSIPRASATTEIKGYPIPACLCLSVVRVCRGPTC